MQVSRFAATRLRDAHPFDWIRPPDKTAPISVAIVAGVTRRSFYATPSNRLSCATHHVVIDVR